LQGPPEFVIRGPVNEISVTPLRVNVKLGVAGARKGIAVFVIPAPRKYVCAPAPAFTVKVAGLPDASKVVT
jgi:hypothetical protein